MDDSALLPVLQAIQKELASTRQALEGHITHEEENYTKFFGAFPDSDPHAHREYHDLLIEREERRKRWAQAFIEKSLSGFLWFVMVSAFLALLHTVLPPKNYEEAAKTILRLGE